MSSMKKTLIALMITGFALTGCSSEADTEAPAPAPAEETPAEEASAEETPQAEETGKRDNPHPLGTTITDGDWELTVNSVNLNATEEIIAANMFNDEPEAGTVYAMVNITTTYNGDDADGEMPMSSVAYVTADGNTINSYDAMIVPPEQFDSMSTLYSGASTTGNIAFPIPEDNAAEGTLAVTAAMMGDKQFFAVK